MPAYLVLLRVEIARFTRTHPRARTTRLCSSNPHLAVDGRYPLPCSMESGLSSMQHVLRHPHSDRLMSFRADYLTRPATRLRFHGFCGRFAHSASPKIMGVIVKASRFIRRQPTRNTENRQGMQMVRRCQRLGIH